MSNVIWMYFNENDLRGFERVLFDNGAILYDDKKQKVTNLSSVSENLGTYTITFDDVTELIFSPCLHLGELQCGSLRLIDDKDTFSRKKFSILKKYVKNTFTYSRELQLYYGPGIYDDWINYKIDNLPVLLKSERFELITDDIEDTLKNIEHSGFVVKPNRVKVRDMNVISSDFKEYVICFDIGDLNRRIERKKFIIHNNNSKCIFVFTDKKKGMLTFVLDDRLKNKSFRIVELFEVMKENQKIIQFWNNKTGDGTVIEP